ncbi:MAG: OsmC family peroxiredoxin [Candidatus Lokiarchaeota archaeon]|nr:OsmC family peroxiredoxin [Candidatus Lokiarchaeota archaeon]
MSDEIKTKVGIKLEEEMIFKCDLGTMKVKDCYIDETNKDEVDMLGPNPSRMLGLAILGCLSASFIFCLKKRVLSLDDLKAIAEVTLARNEKGFLRVKKIDVNIDTIIKDPDARKRAEQCKKMFENYCTVTQSVRDGIKVEVNLNF